MTLTNRLSLFFLTTLAVVLVGFSSALYFLASTYLHGQVEERLHAAVNILTAAAEVAPDGVEWEPAERQLNFGTGSFGEPVAWYVHDNQGRIVDRSTQPAADHFLAEAVPPLQNDQSATGYFDWQGEPWQFRRQRIAPPVPIIAPRATPGKDDRKHPALSITAGVSLAPVLVTLRRLAGVLVGLSLAVWLLALLLGRTVCRRALLPVRHMAASARAMNADDLCRRLPTVDTKDELEDFNRAFNNLLDRLQESFQRQQRFTGDASHQLRTPLTAILGQIEVALRRPRPAAEYEQVLTTVQQQAEHLRHIVESLLFLARADAESRQPVRERIDLTAWLPAHLRSWADHPRACDLHEQSAGLDSAWVAAQPVLLGELVNVLLDNACKYSPPGTPITVRLHHNGKEVTLSVQDQGNGIPDDDQRHIFTPFFRSSEARRRGIEGLGLGLAVAKRLADVCDGELSVTSRVGRGSCFSLRLPDSPPNFLWSLDPKHGIKE